MGQTASVPEQSTKVPHRQTNIQSVITKLSLEHQKLQDLIKKQQICVEEYVRYQKETEEKYNAGMAEIDEMLKNPKPYQYSDPVEAEFERPILKRTETLKDELQKFAEFITGNMDTILASPELNDESDELLFAQLVNSAGFEYARAEVAKRHSAKE